MDFKVGCQKTPSRKLKTEGESETGSSEDKSTKDTSPGKLQREEQRS